MEISRLDQEAIEQLDSIAQIVAGLLEDHTESEEDSEAQRALLTLGRAYLTVYNLLLLEYSMDSQEKVECPETVEEELNGR